MAELSGGVLLQRLHGLLRTPLERQPIDAELLGRFVAERDERAFAALLRRHERLVWSVCRHVARHQHDAEDAFQATFFVLARRAGSIRRPAALASWLHGVAYRIALRTRRQNDARLKRERRVAVAESGLAPASDAVRELQALLDEELANLPELWRVAFILCCLEGNSRAEAARQLGWNEGTVSSRVARARALLQVRLQRRGITLSAALTAGAAWTLTPPQSLRASAPFCQSYVTATPAIERLAAGFGRGFSMKALGATMTLMLAMVATAATFRAEPEEPKPQAVAAPIAKAQPEAEALPNGALRRMGSTRWRHEGEAGSVAFSADGKRLATTNRDNTILVFDTKTGKRLKKIGFSGNNEIPRSLGFSPNGKYLACQTNLGQVQLWDALTLQPVRTLSCPVRVPNMYPDSLHISFSPDGKRLAAVAGGDEISVWNVETGEVVCSLRGHNYLNPPLTFSPDGKVILVGSHAIHFFDALTGVSQRTIKDIQPWSMVFSPDEKTLACSLEDRIAILDGATGKELFHLETPKPKPGTAYHIAYTPDGKALLAMGENSCLTFWDLATRKERLVNSQSFVNRSMALSPDGKTVAIGSAYNLIRLFDVVTGKQLFVDPDEHDAPIPRVGFDTCVRRHTITDAVDSRTMKP